MGLRTQRIPVAGRLRAKQIPTLRPGRHGDGGTLFLVVEPSGRSRHWVQRLTVSGKRRDLGLGGYPYVGLAEARAAAFANRQLARRGGDPTAVVRQSRAPTFRTACERVEAGATWKGLGAENRRRALERYCGSIMDRRIDQIRRADVIAILVPVMAEKRAKGSKLHGWVRGALAWGVAREHLEFNVADGIGAALPSARKAKRHHPALPYSEVGAALKAIAACTASETLKLCLRFIVLTAVRSGEARGATWSEIDLQAAEWRIPEERMKGGCEHRVPLSPAAMATLERARRAAQSGRLVLPGPDAREQADTRNDAGARRADDLREPLHGARLPLVVSRLGERADQRAACGRGGGAGASGRKRRGEVLRPVGPVRQAAWPDGPMGRVCDDADVLTFVRRVDCTGASEADVAAAGVHAGYCNILIIWS